MYSIERHIFPNGLTLLMIENHQAPVLALNICLRVGSRYETNAEAGICHLIEHMLFKGTLKRGPGDIAYQIEASGGDINAYTSFDETVYYCTLSSRHQNKGIEVLADAVLNSTIDAVELEREKEVVIEEIRRGMDSPSRVLSEAVFSKVFQKHNYGRPIIGYEKTVRGFSQKKILDFYHQWYVPENMVVVVSGDFKSSSMFKLCEKLFGSLKNKKPPIRRSQKEPTQNHMRTVSLQKNVQGTHIDLAFPIPAIDHPDIPALDVLSHILGSGESARLDLKLRENRALVNSIYSYAYTPQEPGLFLVGCTLAEENISKACQAIMTEIGQLQDKGVTHDEVARAKMNLKSEAIYAKETVQGIGRKYGYFETILKRYNFDDHYYQAMDSLSHEDIRKAAQSYLSTSQLTTGIIGPQKKKKWKTSEFGNLFKQKTQKISSRKTKKKVSAHPTKYIKLKNGFRLILQENHSLPCVAIRSAHLGGIRAETSKNNGAHALFSQIWGKSSKSRTSEEVARSVELVAGNIDSYTGRNLSGIKMDFLSEKTHEAMDLFLDIFLNPRFDKEEIKNEKKHTLETLSREQDAPASFSMKQFLKTLYPKHPYGLPTLGTTSSVKSLSEKHLQKTFENILNPKNSVIAIVGDFDTDWVLKKLTPALEPLKAPKNMWKAPKADPKPQSVQRIRKNLDKLQAHIIYGFQGIQFSDKDRYALDVLNNILSGQGGRLFIELRDKLSLAYSITSMNQEGIEPGYFGVYIGTEGKKVETAIANIEKELNKILKKNTISQKEIERAKEHLVGTYELDLQRRGATAINLAFNEIYGMTRTEWMDLPKKILAVKKQDIERVAKKIIRLDQAIISIVGPKA